MTATTMLIPRSTRAIKIHGPTSWVNLFQPHEKAAPTGMPLPAGAGPAGGGGGIAPPGGGGGGGGGGGVSDMELLPSWDLSARATHPERDKHHGDTGLMVRSAPPALRSRTARRWRFPRRAG